MGAIALLITFSLLDLCKGEVTPLFVQTGKDLPLEVKEAVTLGETDQLIWSVNDGKDFARLDSTGKPTIFKSHSGRAELFPHNQSLLLRTLTKNDSGGYRARISGDNSKVIAEYKVTVLDPVSPVNLTVNNCSSDSSNLTVTCSTQDSSLNRTFTCDDQSCSEERGEKTPAASLKVYLKKDSIICDHSNQVSRTEDVKKIEDFCERTKADPNPHRTAVTATVVSIFLVTVIVLAAVCIRHRMKGKYLKESVENTVYEVPQVANKDEVPEQRPTDDASPTSPATVYSCLMNPIIAEASPEAGRTLPESLYASVQKPEKSSDNSAPTV